MWPWALSQRLQLEHMRSVHLEYGGERVEKININVSRERWFRHVRGIWTFRMFERIRNEPEVLISKAKGKEGHLERGRHRRHGWHHLLQWEAESKSSLPKHFPCQKLVPSLTMRFPETTGYESREYFTARWNLERRLNQLSCHSRAAAVELNIIEFDTTLARRLNLA